MTLAKSPRQKDRTPCSFTDMNHAVYNVLVLLIFRDLLDGMLQLLQQFDPLNVGHQHLGDGRSHSTSQEVHGEGNRGICHVEREKKRQTEEWWTGLG